jgi:hypothetical protein
MKNRSTAAGIRVIVRRAARQPGARYQSEIEESGYHQDDAQRFLCRFIERAEIDLHFMLLTVAVALICAFRFGMNSTWVMVGAMVISPLLYLVICFGGAP